MFWSSLICEEIHVVALLFSVTRFFSIVFSNFSVVIHKIMSKSGSNVTRKFAIRCSRSQKPSGLCHWIYLFFYVVFSMREASAVLFCFFPLVSWGQHERSECWLFFFFFVLSVLWGQYERSECFFFFLARAKRVVFFFFLARAKRVVFFF